MEKERWKRRGRKCKEEGLGKWEEEKRGEEGGEENDKGRRSERKEKPMNKQVEQLGIGMHDTIRIVRLQYESSH